MSEHERAQAELTPSEGRRCSPALIVCISTGRVSK